MFDHIRQISLKKINGALKFEKLLKRCFNLTNLKNILSQTCEGFYSLKRINLSRKQ